MAQQTASAKIMDEKASETPRELANQQRMNQEEIADGQVGDADITSIGGGHFSKQATATTSNDEATANMSQQHCPRTLSRITKTMKELELVNARDHQGRTPLYLAAQTRDLDNERLLLEHGAIQHTVSPRELANQQRMNQDEIETSEGQVNDSERADITGIGGGHFSKQATATTSNDEATANMSQQHCPRTRGTNAAQTHQQGNSTRGQMNNRPARPTHPEIYQHRSTRLQRDMFAFMKGANVPNSGLYYKKR